MVCEDNDIDYGAHVNISVCRSAISSSHSTITVDSSTGSSKMRANTLFFFACIFSLGSHVFTNAFHVTKQKLALDGTKTASFVESSVQQPCPRTSRASSALFAMKKKDAKGAKKVEEKKPLDPVKLFITYATPTKNPNSIFVYMLLTLYILGKYSEAKSQGLI